MKPEKQRAVISKGKTLWKGIAAKDLTAALLYLLYTFHTALPLEEKQMALGNAHAALDQQRVQGS